MKKYIYLAGPIAGLTEVEATEWRGWVRERLPYGIVGISPLRCEPLKEGMVYTDAVSYTHLTLQTILLV